MIDPRQVSAVIVTKEGPVDPLILASLAGLGEVIVWDNSRRGSDCKVFGRYRAVELATLDYVYTQDDDCVIDAVRLCGEYRPGELLCNLKSSHVAFYEPMGISLVGWGAIFPRSMVNFAPYLAAHPEDDLFYRECDRVFTYLNREKTRIVEIGVEDLARAGGSDRMGTEARHGRDLAEIRARLGILETVRLAT